MDAINVEFSKSPKYDRLVELYRHMAEQGYQTRRGATVHDTYSTQEALKFRDELKPLFERFSIASVLDYGGGSGDWRSKQTPTGEALADYLNIDDYNIFEPALHADDRKECDAVVCFDVLEHVFVADIPLVLADLFRFARRLIVINVANYPAAALLPNGENAHCTLRAPLWWKGAVDVFAAAAPGVHVALYCSTSYGKVEKFPVASMANLSARDGFTR